MNLIKSFGLALVASGLSTAAMAADLPSRKAPPVMVAPAPIFTWTGFYVGLNAGYSWNSGGVNSAAIPGPCDPASGGGCTAPINYSMLSAIGATFGGGSNGGGFIGGAQVGYNMQLSPSFVAGIEADIQGIAGSRRSAASAQLVPSPAFPAQPHLAYGYASASLDYLGTLRGRLGFLVTPTFLLYATGGLAYGGVNVSGNYAQHCLGCNWTIPPFASFGGSQMRVGWTVGGGVEWKMSPRWSVKAEYLYYDLGTASRTGMIIGTNPANGPLFLSSFPTVSARANGHVVRAGVNYHFGGVAGPVVARY